MRHSKDRRDPHAATQFPLEDNARDLVLRDRRKKSERRIENLDAEERQLLLSELPWPILGKRNW
jgi:hypothetical protein